ncbi:glucose-6-phosphate dehydrogenase [Microbacterium sp. SORGH_AS_0888]|uniref:glucose-6-phosphate dehydrogenase n=1 Tax=Microbacterium sp. SORGH_AS_0888 TaxID=3041791 RepID=UPI0027892A1D|nr:glucose-6-phosphate dehydrogenase [Microbacterium sp. SORGH_AS_0888]MDQ1129782.1 glucose-6-phosphate 1-dehydrogenase [Microbacterium sp. SORGH_AS_0888]
MTDDTTLVILGATGDLTSRLLLPALGQLLDDEPDRRVRLMGAGVDQVSDATWRSHVGEAFGPDAGAHARDVAKTTTYRKTDITDAADMKALLAETTGRPVLYFAVPPAVAQASCEALRPGDLPEGTILALEKPFGSDEASAHALNLTLRALLPENQIFRVDHFLGRSTVLNLLGVRFANRVLEPVWKAEHIESVLIRYDETLGLEGRAGYYDKAGALDDMIQSHLLQVLAIVAMEPPATLHEADLRDATTAALRATHVWDDNPVHSSRRAQYTAGTAAGERMPSYADEPGVDPARQTETLAEATFEVRTARWEGVPFTLRSGKALGSAVHEIVLSFRPVRHLPDGFTGEAPGSVLRFSLGPDAISLELNVNGREDPWALGRAALETDLGTGALRAYADVLANILDGDAALAVRGDAAEQCWRIVQPVIDAWRRGDVPLDHYPAGSEGPEGWPALP